MFQNSTPHINLLLLRDVKNMYGSVIFLSVTVNLQMSLFILLFYIYHYFIKFNYLICSFLLDELSSSLYLATQLTVAKVVSYVTIKVRSLKLTRDIYLSITNCVNIF